LSVGTAGARSSDAATRALLLVLIVTVPLAVAPGTSPTRSYPRYVLLVAGAVAATVLVVAAAVLGGRRPAWRNGLHRPVLVLVGWTAVCALLSDDVGTAIGGFPGSYNGLSTAIALALLFFVAASLSPLEGRRLLEALWYGAGSVVALYGLVQLAERLVGPPGRGWDVFPPATASWSISSMLGNPNHLAGFAAMVLPVVAVLWALSDSRRRRRLVAAMSAVLVVELVATGSRGGWAAVLAAGATLAVLFRRELAPLRARALPVAAAVSGVVVVTAVVVGTTGVAKRGLGDVAHVGAGSTLDLRVQLWRIAGDMAVAHPVVGVGPDGFVSAFPDHVSAQFADRFGAFSVATDAHNIFATAAANLGLPGLSALRWLVAAAGRQTARGWRRLTVAADRGDAGARVERLLLGGVAAGLVGYLVQASANTQPVSLSFVAWMLLAVACLLARAPGAQAERAGPGQARRRPTAVLVLGRR
jgi:O-antigen ligase